MPQRADGPHVNPADETIGTKGLAVRFLLTGDNSNGSVAAFELVVPACAAAAGPGAQPRPLRGDDLRHRRGVDLDRRRKSRSMSGRDRRSAFRAAPFIGSTTTASRDAKALCVITPAAIGPEYFREAFAVLNAAAGGPRTGPSWRKSCAVTV